MAAPTYVGHGAADFGTGNSRSLALPVGWQEGDIFLMQVTGNPFPLDGWYQISRAGGNGTMNIFWKRAAASETDPVVVTGDLGNQSIGVIHAFRGCAATGNPIDENVVSGFKSPSSTAYVADGFETTADDCLVVASNTNGLDNSTGPRMSAWANSSLTDVAERVDQWTSASGGIGLALATGVKSTAGTVANTTATSNASSTHVWQHFALRPAGAEYPFVYKNPTFVGRGSAVSTGAGGTIVTPLPSGVQENDILLWMVGTDKSIGPSGEIFTPAGWDHVAGSPVGGGGSFKLLWKRAGASESDPSIETGFGFEYYIGQIAAFRGCATEGVPWNVTAKTTDGSSDATRTLVGLTTTTAHCTVVQLCNDGADNHTGSRLYNLRNSSLEFVQPIANEWTASGGGSGFGGLYGTKRVAGEVLNGAATSTASETSSTISLALRPDAPAASRAMVIF